MAQLRDPARGPVARLSLTNDVVHAQWESDQRNPFLTFDGIFCINLDNRPDRWKRMHRRFDQLGIAAQVRRISAIPTTNSHVGCALSHRRALEMAHKENMETVLVLEDDAVFLEGARWVLRRSLDELATQDWRLLYLGSFPSRPYPLVHGCHHLEVVNGLMGAHAVVYHRRLYEELLAEMPADMPAMTEWARRHPIDTFLARTLTDGVFRVAPMIASQEALHPQDARRPARPPGSSRRPDGTSGEVAIIGRAARQMLVLPSMAGHRTQHGPEIEFVPGYSPGNELNFGMVGRCQVMEMAR